MLMADFVLLIILLFWGGMVKLRKFYVLVNILSWDFVLLIIPLFSGGMVKPMKVKMVATILSLECVNWVDRC